VQTVRLISYRHGKQTRLVMLQIEVLVGEGFGAVNTGAACSIAIEEIATLTHEVGYLPIILSFHRSCFHTSNVLRTILWNFDPL
jgi:hypothetical protein